MPKAKHTQLQSLKKSLDVIEYCLTHMFESLPLRIVVLFLIESLVANLCETVIIDSRVTDDTADRLLIRMMREEIHNHNHSW